MAVFLLQKAKDNQITRKNKNNKKKVIMKRPRKLKKGDKVAIVSLSSGVLGEPFAKNELEQGLKRMKEFGLEPVLMPNALKGMKYLAEHPEKRASDLKTAFLDDSIAAIICAIGGEDTYRLAPFLLEDPEFRDAVRNHPKIFTGFSDTTVNHLMLNQLGLVTYYGPNLINDLAELDTEMLPYTKKTFAQYFNNQTNWEVKSSPIWYEERTDFSVAALNTPRIAHEEKRGYEVLRGAGQVTGELFGGCIESLDDLLNTERNQAEVELAEKYELLPQADFWNDKILFIETSEERPDPASYRTMLQRLDKRGIIKRVQAILVGKPQNELYYEDYQQILLQETEKAKTPILMNVNFGHAYPRTVLPYSTKATIDFDKKTITVLEKMFSD